MLTRIGFVLPAAFALAFAGCKDSTGPKETGQTPARIVLEDSVITAYRNVEVQLKAAVYDRNQRPLSAPITWASSDTSVATVDAAGLVHPRGLGTARVTATAGAVSASATVTVAQDLIAPVITSLEVTRSVDLSQGDATIEVVASFREGESGAARFRALVWTADRSVAPYWCSADRPSSGTRFEGTFRCTIRISGGAAPGTWVAWGYVAQREGRLEGEFGGVEIEVKGSAPDDESPVLTGIQISPDSVDVTSQDARVNIRVAGIDSGAGLATMELLVVDEATGNPYYGGNHYVDPADGSSAQAEIVFELVARAGSGPTRWVISEVALVDRRGNETRLTTEDLRAAGHPVLVTITRS